MLLRSFWYIWILFASVVCALVLTRLTPTISKARAERAVCKLIKCKDKVVRAPLLVIKRSSVVKATSCRSVSGRLDCVTVKP